MNRLSTYASKVTITFALLFSTLLLPPAERAAASPDKPPTIPAELLKGMAVSEEQLAYSLGIQAYIYGYPLVISAKTRGEMTHNRAPLNQMYYSESLASPSFHDIVTPNSDTLYMNAWLDLSQTPLLLQVPADPNNRYYTVQMLDAYTNTFRNVSSTTTNGQDGRYLIVGPTWKGTLPEQTTKIEAPTNSVWLIGRVGVNGEKDLPAAVAFEKQITLTPLPASKQKAVQTSPLLPADIMDSLSFFEVMTAMIRQNPPPACDQVLLTQFALAGIHIRTGFHPDQVSPATLAGLKRAVKDAPAIVQNGYPPYIHVRNGWGWFSPIGSYGNQFLARAFIAYSGLGANVPEEEAYYRAYTDGEGMPLAGAKNYILHFERDQLPKTRAFWSINVYNNQLYLATTAANRSSVRSNSGTLVTNPDGSLDIYIQKTPPSGKESNWLPTPNGPFNLVLRVFAPEPGVSYKRANWPPVREQKPTP